MADTERIARIRAYLEKHRDSYDRDALRQQLLADGHDPEAIDAAMAQVYHSDDPVTHSSTNRMMVSAPLVAFGIVLLNAGACFVSLRTIGLIPLIVGLLLQLGAAGLIRKRHPTIARGINLGVLTWFILTLALVVFVMFSLGYMR